MTAQEIIEKIRSEIERRKEEAIKNTKNNDFDEVFYSGKSVALGSLLSFLSDLEKEEKPVPNDLDFGQELYNHFGQVKDFTLGMQIAKHFYELGRQNKEQPEKWTKKDEKMIKAIAESLTAYSGNITPLVKPCVIAQDVPLSKALNWLKNRMPPQWTEEDEKNRGFCYWVLSSLTSKEAEEAKKWISSLRPFDKQPVSEGLEEEIDACWQNWLSPSNQKEVEEVLPKTEFAMYARHFAKWGADHTKKDEIPVPTNLKEAAYEYEQTRRDTDARSDNEIVRRAFIAGAKWQEKRNLRFVKQVLSGDFTVFEAGRKYERKQMMQEAVKGEVVVPLYEGRCEGNDIWSTEIKIPGRYEVGDKVKIIIIEEDR